MKTIYLALTLFIFQSLSVQAQWVQQTSGTNATLFAVHFVSAQRGWAAGANGTLLATNNGGQTWLPQTSGVTTSLNAIWFVDSLNGWATGDLGVIISTTNGGQTWSPQTSNSVSKMRTIWFLNADTGYVAGQGGIYLRTVNGGGLWMQVGTSVNQDIYSLGFADQTTGYLSGRNGNFQKTVTGGTSWTNGPPPSLLDTLKCVRAPGVTDVFVTTSTGKVLKTDGSGNWTTQQPGSAKSLNGSWFTNPSIGWVAGDSGRVFSTTTGGAFWTMQSSSTTERLWAVHFPNDSAGWCVGANGTIIKLSVLTTSALQYEQVNSIAKIYPNPAKTGSILQLQFNSTPLEQYSIEIRNTASGQVCVPAFTVYSRNGDLYSLPTETLRAGNYSVTIRNLRTPKVYTTSFILVN